MSTDNLPKIILNNPLIFMDENYLNRKFIKGKFSKGKIIPIYQNEIPIKIIFIFSEESLTNDFFLEFNNKTFTEELDYKLSLIKVTESEEEIKKNMKIIQN